MTNKKGHSGRQSIRYDATTVSYTFEGRQKLFTHTQKCVKVKNNVVNLSLCDTNLLFTQQHDGKKGRVDVSTKFLPCCLCQQAAAAAAAAAAAEAAVALHTEQSKQLTHMCVRARGRHGPGRVGLHRPSGSGRTGARAWRSRWSPITSGVYQLVQGWIRFYSTQEGQIGTNPWKRSQTFSSNYQNQPRRWLRLIREAKI